MKNQSPYYHDPANVEAYIEMAKAIDSRMLIDRLRDHLPAGSTVLELGMGPGKDLDLLQEHYAATGSDYSPAFLAAYQLRKPRADLLLLDALTLDTERQFDAIYSNKVLHHLPSPALTTSLHRQGKLLGEGGVLLHTFWHGYQQNEHEGLFFCQYTAEELLKYVPENFRLIEMSYYEELHPDDSFYLILRKCSTLM